MARHESSAGFFTTIAVVLPVVVVGVVAGMVKVPTYFANRDAEIAVNTVVHQIDPTAPDDRVIEAINTHMFDVKASRYWVENGRQMMQLDLQFKGDQVKIERDGTRSMTITITYTQQMWVPLLNRVDLQTFVVRADNKSKS